MKTRFIIIHYEYWIYAYETAAPDRIRHKFCFFLNTKKDFFLRFFPLQAHNNKNSKLKFLFNKPEDGDDND